MLDLTVLFEPKQLRVVAAKIKEDTLVSPLQQHHSALIRWLEERYSRGAVSGILYFSFVYLYLKRDFDKKGSKMEQ